MHVTFSCCVTDNPQMIGTCKISVYAHSQHIFWVAQLQAT